MSDVDQIVQAHSDGYTKGQARINISFQAGYDGAMGKKSDRLYQPTEAELEWERRGYIVGLVDSGEFVSPLATLKKELEKSAADYQAVSMSLQTPDLQTLAANIAANHLSIAQKIQDWLTAVEKSGLGDL